MTMSLGRRLVGSVVACQPLLRHASLSYRSAARTVVASDSPRLNLQLELSACHSRGFSSQGHRQRRFRLPEVVTRFDSLPLPQFGLAGLRQDRSYALDSQRWTRFFSPAALDILRTLLAKAPKGFEDWFTDNKGESILKGKKGSKEKKPEGGGGGSSVVPLLLMTAAAAYIMAPSRDELGDEISFQQFYADHLSKGLVQRLRVDNRQTCYVYLYRPEGAPAQAPFKMQIGSVEKFEERLEQAQRSLGINPIDFLPVEYSYKTQWSDVILRLLPTIIFLASMVFMFRFINSTSGALGRGGRDPFSMGKANVGTGKEIESKVRFPDVAGLTQAKVEVTEFVDFLKAPQKFEALGARIPKGGLLVGPPGTGKTLLAKAVAGEAGVPFFSMSGSEFVEMFVGVGASRVRDLFDKARKAAPSIVFIDEIDAVGKKRSKGGFSSGGNDERESTLNQLLVEMDGFSAGTKIVVLAGTNRADILDPALTRPGRFDRRISVDKPDLNDREQIFKVHLKPVKLHKNLTADAAAKRLAALTPGFVGADIANLCNEAAIFAARRNQPAVELEDFERASERVMAGSAKVNSLMSQEEKRTVAVHESGHAVAGWFLKHADPLLKVTIVPRSSGALGFAQYLPEEIALHSQEAIKDKMCVALGGRAAEELFCKAISTGASDDLDKVTKMAYSMILQYGMNKNIGLVSFRSDPEQIQKPYSEATGKLIDMEARELIEEQYTRVKELLEEKRDLLHALADDLKHKETVVFNDLVRVLGERPFPIKEEYRKFIDTRAGASDPHTGGDSSAPSEDSSESAEGGDDSKEGFPAGATPVAA